MTRAIGLFLLLIAPSPVLAQRDLAGNWAALYHEDQPHRIPGPDLGDYTGIPLNDAGRLKADSWDASILTLREHQAKPHPSTYSLRGPANIRITRVLDPVTQQTIGYELFGTFGQATREIWIDGRPRPPAHAAHTWAGFSTARWDGDALEVTTSHLKAGWLQRNGVAHSDKATMTERFIRHGNHLMVVTIVDDPIYLEEPFIRTTNWILNPDQEVRRTQFDVVDEVAVRRKGEVPHYLPGSADAARKLTEFASRYKVPADAARGAAATLYPGGVRPLESSPVKGSDPAPPGEIHVVHVQGNVHMLVGAGGNVVVQAGNEGVLVVDTGAEARAADLLAAIRKISDKPIRIVINTHVHADHTGANEAIAATGKALSGNAPGNSGLALASARVLAHENVLKRMGAPSGQPSPRPFGAWPTETFFGEDKEIFFNDEAIQLFYRPGHTDGDVVVFFRKSDVVVSGDLFLTTNYPVIDAEHGGNVTGIIDGLNHILDLTIPRDKQEGGTYVVPGHGRLSDEADVAEYRDMLTIVRDRIQDLVMKGRSLAEVNAARPTLDYDGRYDATTGWTRDMFIDAVYRGLATKR
ncbi:MAG TPA: MBL fold metallo-hydrolase [Vicinamibacterales bacterium]|nr:MBL fold metallo-hydrolase [Vicinamibacterales bacterium]